MTSVSTPLKPLSLGKRPLQLNSSSPADLKQEQSPVISPTSTVANSELKKESRHQKRYSTLSYASSPLVDTFEQSPSQVVTPKATRRSSVDAAALLRQETAKPSKVVSDNDPGSVLTLAEKHADLLQFIAQKEAKCLELRTQLSQHEADLKQLKAKWASILNRANPASSPLSPSYGDSYAISSASAIRDGVGRILSGVAAPLLQSPTSTGMHPNTPNTTVSPLGIVSEPTDSTQEPTQTDNTAEAMAGHGTPTSSNRSSSSSISFNRHSISSASSIFEEPETAFKSIVPKGIANSPRRSSLLINSSTAPPEEKQSATQADMGLTSWTAAVLPATINRKWEEIQKTETYLKGSKRASILFSDVSASLVGAFAPLPPAPKKPRLVSSVTKSTSGTKRTSGSLLDGDNEDLHSSTSESGVMIPNKIDEHHETPSQEKEEPRTNNVNEAWIW